MIAAIITTTQYGKTSTDEDTVVYQFGLDDASSTAYAHSVQDVLEWLRRFPLYKDADFDSLGDGRFRIVSPWMEMPFTGILDDPRLKNIDRSREEIVVYPVNTIYENSGFRVPEA